MMRLNIVLLISFCCAKAELPIPGDYLGEFELIEHEVQGQVYALNSNTLYVHRFYYDGEAPPGVHFRVLRKGERDLAKAQVIGDVPELKNGKDLDGRTLNRDITLEMPIKLKDASRLLVWCEQFGVAFGQLDLEKAQQNPPKRPENLVEVGKLTETEHAVHGRVFRRGRDELVIRDFNFDGRGPKAFFSIGTSNNVGEDGIGVQLEEQSKSRLGIKGLPRIRQRDVVIKVPKNVKSEDIKWLAVWCETFDVSFGHVYFQ